MKCDDFRELAFAFTAGSLDEEQHAACRAHLEQPRHEGCQEALSDARALLRQMEDALPAPGESVWRAIEEEVRASKVVPLAKGPRALSLVAIAAGIAAVVFAAGYLHERDLRSKAESSLVAEQQRARELGEEKERLLARVSALSGELTLARRMTSMLQQPASSVVHLAPQPDKNVAASAIVGSEDNRILVLSTSLPAREGKTYQLWIIRGSSAPVPAGFLRVRDDGIAEGEIDPKLLQGAAPDAIAISLEPAGGRPTPTDVLLVGTL